jgi:hypothetical protein
MPSSYDRVVQLVSTLSQADLKRLQQLVNMLVEDGCMPATGHLEYRFVTRSGKRYGPYKYQRFWRNGKLVDQYLGKASQEEYDQWLARHAAPASE